ncbi:MAG TPA: 16S rRNA (cytosine(967)-C(5))-methyltransferase RsmB [Candidatus Methanoperedens sp.]
MNPQFSRQKVFYSILNLLGSIIDHKRYADREIGNLFKNKEFTESEKAAIVEVVYGMLRNRNWIDYTIEKTSGVRIPGINPKTVNIFRICAYQALYSSASSAGILNNAVALSSHHENFSGFVERTVETMLRNKDSIVFPDKKECLHEYISVLHSHPVWIVEKWLREFGHSEEVIALCRANNIAPPLTIRINPLKTDAEALGKSLNAEGFVSLRTPFSPYGLILEKKAGIFRTRAFAGGKFEVMDEGSQLITLLTCAGAGECIVDACAGNGGKTLFLSGLMKNRGKIIACDPVKSKLENLIRRAKRAGASNIEAIDTDNLGKYLERADCVLIDAPCSGMGVFRRNPDAKWRLDQRDITELAEKQRKILEDYSRLVKSGGRLVYATCTVSKEENEDVVKAFLNENREFEIMPPDLSIPGSLTGEGFFRLLPHIHNTDGFFGAVMRKRE